MELYNESKVIFNVIRLCGLAPYTVVLTSTIVGAPAKLQWSIYWCIYSVLLNICIGKLSFLIHFLTLKSLIIKIFHLSCCIDLCNYSWFSSEWVMLWTKVVAFLYITSNTIFPFRLNLFNYLYWLNASAMVCICLIGCSHSCFRLQESSRICKELQKVYQRR